MSEKKGFLGGLFGGKKGGNGCCNMEIVEESEGGSCCGGSCIPETMTQAVASGELKKEVKVLNQEVQE